MTAVGPDSTAVLRIGELSRRVGVSEHVLRVWERRYGVLKPARSAGGFRLYSAADVARIRRMRAHQQRGLSTAEAARAALAEEDRQPAAQVPADADRRTGLDEARNALRRALDDLDEGRAQSVLDRLLTDFTVETVLRDVVVPYLHELGLRWQRGEVSVTEEHFASNVVRGRLAGLARGWGMGRGPLALLACPPGELHDLGLLMFGIVLHRTGWRVDYLGGDTPLDGLIRSAVERRPDLVVVAATSPDRFAAAATDLVRLAEVASLALAGAGATAEITAATGARLLGDDPVTAAQRLLPGSPFPGW
ncbi:MAG: MerR family transcriptional regulator [Jiangellaceae bacterium]|nr:MerR family transcriptional regulator [Jiangellaceae bacterium]